MFPFFNVFGKTISMYSIMALAGALCAGLYSCRAALRRFPDYMDTLVLLLISAAGAVVGGHILYAFTQYEELFYFLGNFGKINSFRSMAGVLSYLFGGSVFYGGLLGGILFGMIYLKKGKKNFYEYGDIVAAAIPLFHAFGRVGCFFSGCCYGVECSFGITFSSSPVPGANGVHRFPVQLLEAGFNMTLFILLAVLFYKNKIKGRLFLLYLIIYSCARFCFEFLRGDEIRGFLLGFSTSQIISAAVFIISLFLFIRRRKTEESSVMRNI